MNFDSPTRRDAFRIAVAAGVATLPVVYCTAEEVAFLQPVAPVVNSQLTPYLYGGQVLLRWNNVVVAAYRANPVQKFPYFTDLVGPITGLPLTTESSEPFPHHRGLWLGCDPLNGGNYWRDEELESGQIRSIDLQLGDATPNCVEIRNRCQWVRRSSASPLLDERRITFTVVDDRVRLLDLDIKLTALQDLRISKAKHSFFALRTTPDIAPAGGGTLINAEGKSGESNTYGQPTAWCSYFGKRTGHSDVVEGITVMDHPENPWAPCPWFTRDYGHLSPSPFNFLASAWELSEGASIRLRYRVALHAGGPREVGMDQLFREWTAA